MVFSVRLSSLSYFPHTTRSHKKTLIPIPAIPHLSSASNLDISSVFNDTTLTAVFGGSSVAALVAAISLSDPEKRRQLQAEEVQGDDKEVVREYFNKSGFQRWRKIYGDTDDVNGVQRDIRVGHASTVERAVKMLTEEGSLRGVTICDAGCGTGSLTIPLAKRGAIVLASDISTAMVAEAIKQAEEELGASTTPLMPTFEVRDLESLDGKYDAVVCLDVLIHYPQTKISGMISHLASLAKDRLILSFAPKTIYFDMLKRVGELFPGPSKATRAYLHAQKDVEMALQNAGWRIRKTQFISTQFYFSTLVEAAPL